MLLEKEVITEKKTDRKTPSFTDPTETGIATLTKGDWLEKQLSAKSEINLQEEQNHGEVDMDYELADSV